jgi:RND superfamily putative drug exporter
MTAASADFNSSMTQSMPKVFGFVLLFAFGLLLLSFRSLVIVAKAIVLNLLKEKGIGLATAVLIDATIVRAVLLPATMKLLGERNWYLPSWPEWLPRLDHGAGPAPAAEAEARPAPAAA